MKVMYSKMILRCCSYVFSVQFYVSRSIVKINLRYLNTYKSSVSSIMEYMLINCARTIPFSEKMDFDYYNSLATYWWPIYLNDLLITETPVLLPLRTKTPIFLCCLDRKMKIQKPCWLRVWQQRWKLWWLRATSVPQQISIHISHHWSTTRSRSNFRGLTLQKVSVH